MSKRCHHCGSVNDDSRIYCSSCGELLDANLQLLKDLTDQTSGPKKRTYKAPPPRREPVRSPRPYFDDDPPPKLAREKKASHAALWIIVGIALVVVGVLIVSYAV